MNFQSLLHKITNLDKLDLQGAIAHNRLMDLQIRNQIFKDVKHKDPKKPAAVLVLLYPDENNRTKMAFILRNNYKGHHSGQISFPGGKKEVFDVNLEETALRETQEEIGIPSESITIVKKLTPIFIPISNFQVQPFLAITKEIPQFKIDPVEVQKLIELPLDAILNNELVTISHTYFGKTYQMKAFQVNKLKIWGATAMILAEVVALLK